MGLPPPRNAVCSQGLSCSCDPSVEQLCRNERLDGSPRGWEPPPSTGSSVGAQSYLPPASEMRLLLTAAGRKCATQRPVTIRVPYVHPPGPCALKLNHSLVENPQSIPRDLGPASTFPTWQLEVTRRPNWRTHKACRIRAGPQRETDGTYKMVDSGRL